MNIKRIVIYVIIVCIFFITAAQSVHAAVLELVTPTKTVSPTRPTGAPTQTSTTTPTPTQTPTTTLIPLPAITLIFPVTSPTPTETVTPTPLHDDGTPQPAGTGGISTLSPRFKLLAVLITLLWIILIGFAVFYIRQFR